MLFKLLKYEIKASGRTLIPLYIGILALSVVIGLAFSGLVNQVQYNGFLFSAFEEAGTLSGLLMLLLFALYIALGVLTILSIIQRFNNNLLGDEGFLMFTLPVKSTTLLLSKLLAAMCWVVLAGFIGFLSMSIIVAMILIFTPEFNFFNELAYLWEAVIENITFEKISLMLKSLVLSLLDLCGVILTAYWAMMIGQLQKFANHRIIVSFVAFFVINWLYSVITNPILGPFSYNITSYEVFGSYLWVHIIISAIEAIATFFIVNFMTQKYLNL